MMTLCGGFPVALSKPADTALPVATSEEAGEKETVSSSLSLWVWEATCYSEIHQKISDFNLNSV